MANKLHELSTALADHVERAAPAVVELIGARVPASATIWSEEGLAITVDHAMGSSRNGRVRLHDGREVAAEVIGRDASTDLALLRLDLPDDFRPSLPRADASPRVGELTLTLGRVDGGPVATLGMLAAIGGPWRSRFGANFEARYDVDSALPPGSAGGPLLDVHGRVLGINTHGLVPGGTTVPLASVAAAAARLEAHGDLRPGFLGVRFSAARLSDHPDRSRALVVTGIGDDSAAAQAGVKVGDLLLSVAGQPVRRGDDLLAALATRAGVVTPVELWRGGEGVTVEVTPVERKRWWRRRRKRPDASDELKN